MMTPKFTDVVEFVRGGEDDPEMEALLKQHPDGRELLKQARFINKMLERKIDEWDSPGKAAGMDRYVAQSARQMKQALYEDYEDSVAEMHSLSLDAPLSLMDDFDDRRRSEDP